MWMLTVKRIQAAARAAATAVEILGSGCLTKCQQQNYFDVSSKRPAATAVEAAV